MTMPSRIASHPIAYAVVFTIYLGLGGLGQVRLPFGSSPIWFASGFALAAFLLVGRRVWPAVLLAAFLTRVTSLADVLPALAIAAGNTLEGLAGAALIARVAKGTAVFQTAETIFRSAVIMALSATIGATISTAAVGIAAGTPLTELPSVWMTWWLGDLTGSVVLAPLVVLWATTPVGRVRLLDVLEAIALYSALTLVGLIVFAGKFPSDVKDYPLEFLCAPFLLWAVFRFGRREAATAMVLLTSMAVWGTVRGYGPFVRDTPNESLVLLQAYTCVMAIMCLVLASSVSEHKQAERRLEELALTDPLTGLSNYRRLLDVLRAEINRSARTRRPLAVLLLDMNGLKQINDRYGHMVGSRALCRLGETLRASSRSIDTACRFGGDEFAIVLPECGAEGASKVLDRIRSQLAHDILVPKLSVSGGFAVFPEDGESATMLLRAADTSLYMAKTGGRGDRTLSLETPDPDDLESPGSPTDRATHRA